MKILGATKDIEVWEKEGVIYIREKGIWKRLLTSRLEPEDPIPEFLEHWRSETRLTITHERIEKYAKKYGISLEDIRDMTSQE